MKAYRAIIWVTAFCAVVTVRAQTTEFTYQGRLAEGSEPATGEYLFEFRLFGSAEDGEVIGEPQGPGPLLVREGLFTVQLDFGEGMAGPGARWLEVSVRTNAVDSEFTVLAPRQPVTPGPRAWWAERAELAARAEEADRAMVAGLAEEVMAGSITASSVVPGSLLGVNLAAEQVVRSLNGFRDDVVLEGGRNVVVRPTAQGLAVDAEAWGLRGNEGTDGSTQFVGTTDAAPLELRVNNQRVMRYEVSTNSVVSVLGGDGGNLVRPGALGVTIAGGGTTFGGGTDWRHRVDAAYGTVGGGMAHRLGVNATLSTVSGGFSNRVEELSEMSVIAGGGENLIGANAFRSTISGGYQNGIGVGAYFSTIGGGWTNQVRGYISTVAGGNQHTIDAGAPFSTIGGGISNRVDGTARSGTIAGGGRNRIQTGSIRTVISGGVDNVVGSNSPHSVIGGGLGHWIGNGAEGAVIPGGISNRVDGAYGFAAGQEAQALHRGAFVWADTPDGVAWPFASEAANEAAFRVTGGMRVVTGLDGAGEASSGVSVAAGSGSWSSLSDRAAKTDFAPVDVEEVLAQVTRLPVQSWRYQAESGGGRHMGPVAQDFHAAFGLGTDDGTIATVDADGVALAAIQGLYRLLREQQAEIAMLRRDLEALTRRD